MYFNKEGKYYKIEAGLYLLREAVEVRKMLDDINTGRDFLNEEILNDLISELLDELDQIVQEEDQ